MATLPRMMVIINASSGADDKEDVRRRLLEIFNASHVPVEIALARSGDEIMHLARRAAAGDYQIIVAGGGDGTINTIASMIAGTGTTLGILPLGTLNHFAKDLRIPLDLEEAARIIIGGYVAAVDVGEINGRMFLNNSSIGLYPSIVRRRDAQQQRLGRGKWRAFFWAALTVLRRYPFFAVRLSAGDQQFVRRTPFVFVGNNEYEMNSFNIGARSCLNAGQLSLYVAHRVGRLRLLHLLLSALAGRLSEAADFDALCAKEVWIETRRKRLRVALDGEVTMMTPPLHCRVRPGLLRVVVPPPGK